MALRIRQIGLDATPSTQLSLGTLARVLRPAILAEVIDRCAAREKRAATAGLNRVAVVRSHEPVLERLSHPRLLLIGEQDAMATGRPGRAAGEQGGTVPGSLPPGSQTFGRTLPGGVQASGHILDAPALLFGLRLMALDATVMDVPDTPENVRAFGKRRTPRGESAWPQIRLVAISECSTTPCARRACGPRFRRARSRTQVARSRSGGRDAGVVGPRVPQLRDVRRARPRSPSARVPARYGQTASDSTLADGTKLVVLHRRHPPDEEELGRGELTSVTVRLIHYTLEDPDRPGHRIEHRLITSHWTRMSPPLRRSLLPTTPAGSSSLPSMRSRPTSANPKSLCAPRGRWASFKKPTGFWWPTT